MPTLDSLANSGLCYNEFHTTALCSPTRMALLTGRNHHMVNTGAIMEVATSFPGNTGVRPQSTATLPEILKLNGGMTGLGENVFINIKNHSFTITADVDIPKASTNGVILAQEGRFGGWSLYFKNSKGITHKKAECHFSREQ